VKEITKKKVTIKPAEDLREKWGGTKNFRSRGQRGGKNSQEQFKKKKRIDYTI